MPLLAFPDAIRAAYGVCGVHPLTQGYPGLAKSRALLRNKKMRVQQNKG
jgi:hypothetical protein